MNSCDIPVNVRMTLNLIFYNRIDMHKFILLYISFIPLCLSSILNLDDSNFDSNIIKRDIALVVFHTPWCGQCKKLSPILEKVSWLLDQQNQQIPIIKLNCEKAASKTCDKFKIGAYPILKSFRKGQEFGTFEGTREVKTIIDFVKEEAAPSSIEFSNETDLEALMKQSRKVTFVAYLAKNSELEKIFFLTADKLRRKLRFAHCYCTGERGESRNTAKLFYPYFLRNKFEPNAIPYKGDLQSSSIESFISENYHGLVGIRQYYNKVDFKYPLVVAYYDVNYVNNPKGTNYWRNRILQVAEKYKNNFNFAISPTYEFSEELAALGVNISSCAKPFIVLENENEEKFKIQHEFSVERFDEFLTDILNENIHPYLKSQPLPVRNKGTVIVAVGGNFYDVVMNDINDTFIKLFAPWCKYCTKMAPAYEEVATLLKDEKISIVEIDATQNDVPAAYAPIGYPTLYWANKDAKYQPVRYDGKRTKEDLLKFIAKHASEELKHYDRNGIRKSGKPEL